MIVIRVTTLMKVKHESDFAQGDNFDMKVKVIVIRVTTLVKVKVFKNSVPKLSGWHSGCQRYQRGNNFQGM